MGIRAWKDRLAARAKLLKRDTFALYLAVRDPSTPWYAKAFCALVVGYALSPIDLIPDFIPVLGQLDDLILVPAGIALALRMLPKELLARVRARAEAELSGRAPGNGFAALVIVGIWFLVLALVAKALFFPGRR